MPFPEAAVRVISIDPSTPTRVLAAGERALYESRDRGASWQQRWLLPGTTLPTAIAIDPFEPSTLLLATTQGLYASFDAGWSWQLVFRGRGDTEAHGTDVVFHPTQAGIALLGTMHGLFMSSDHGRRWTPQRLPTEANEIIELAFDAKEPDLVYVLSSDGLFVGNLTTGEWHQRFSALHAEESAGEESEATETAEDDEASLPRLRAFVVDPASSRMYLATSRRVQMSDDGGLTWRPLSSTGLMAMSVSRLLIHERGSSVLYAGTSRGVARYDAAREQWVSLATGQAASRVNDLAASTDALWAATDDGLYRYPATSQKVQEPPPTPRDPLANFSKEPTIGQVREVAIRYAEVHPSKIASWRTQARLKASLPTVSTGVKNNVTDKWDWESGSTSVGYDNHLLRGKEALEWDVSLSWDLGDLIWSTDQTSIDTRSKLMVELRTDLVDELTRTYFERRRLQTKLLTEPPKDPNKRLEQELRIQELTALLDGFTGGYFSKQLERHRAPEP